MVSFVKLVENYGIYPEFTCYTDILDSSHWPTLVSWLKDRPEVLLEYCNEKHYPNVGHQKSPYHLCSHGSGLSDDDPVEPVWDYGSVHWNDASEWQRKSGHNTAELAVRYGKPMHAGENTRFSDRDSSLAHAYDSAAGCKLFNAGYCYHSVNGKNSTLWEGDQLAAAIETVKGANSVELKYRLGFYRNLEPESYLRRYSKSLGDDVKIVPIRY